MIIVILNKMFFKFYFIANVRPKQLLSVPKYDNFLSYTLTLLYSD